MAVKTVQYIFNGQTYNLTYNSTSGKYEATVTAPGKSSYGQTDHVLGGTVKATDVAGEHGDGRSEPCHTWSISQNPCEREGRSGHFNYRTNNRIIYYYSDSGN